VIYSPGQDPMILECLRSPRVHSWSHAISIAMAASYLSAFGACHNAPVPQVHRNLPTHDGRVLPVSGIEGLATYDDGTPAADACLVFTDIASGAQAAVSVADAAGKFITTVSAGEYAVAATGQRGAVWIERLTISRDGFTVKLAGDCRGTAGTIVGDVQPDTRIVFGRRSFSTGDTFTTMARPDGTFSLCLPHGDYIASLEGGMLSLGSSVSIPSNNPIVLRGYSRSEVRHVPASVKLAAYHIDGLVNDIVRSNARLVGIGEATHGSAEFVTARSTLIFDLARRAQLRLVLLENDAISSHALERYVNGDNVDLRAAIAELGFWITDTAEFIHFFEQVRSYNLSLATATDRIHIHGVDVQSTKPSVALIMANAQALKLNSDEQTLLQLLGPDRGKAVKQLDAKRRGDLDATLARLSRPTGSAELDTRIAIAARSLAIQVGFLDGDTQGLYMQRREAGMAQLARYIVERSGAKRAALWAHNDHVSRHIGGVDSVGSTLADVFSNSYYPIGFFFYEGSTRAWDAAGKIGVVSHVIGAAPAFTVEGAVMSMTGFPTIAWLPLSSLPPALHRWLEVPRYVREVGAVYNGEDRATVLLNIKAAFDAIVVIRSIRDSSPTPTGVRRIKS
jgi:erythromycin esterase